MSRQRSESEEKEIIFTNFLSNEESEFSILFYQNLKKKKKKIKKNRSYSQSNGVRNLTGAGKPRKMKYEITRIVTKQNESSILLSYRNIE